MKESQQFINASTAQLKRALIVTASFFLGVASVNAKDLPGSSETSWSVAPSGAFQFNLSIMAPKGRNGIKPNLSINYSSSQGNGSLGVGWNVSGLSAITRCGQTQATNGRTKGVVHGETDRFCMAGQQLRLISSGDYGDDNTEYRTEVEQFAKIVADGNGSKNLIDSGTAPTSWKVWAKDGRIYTYGGTSDSRLQINNTSNSTQSTHRWSLSKVEDRSGNYYTVSYRTEDGLPLQIKYTFNSAGINAKQQVDYVYDSRPDIRKRYVFGRLIIQNQRLSNIKVLNNGSVYRDYKFNYEERLTGDLRPSRLSSIEECGLASTCMPEVPISWVAETNGFDLEQNATVSDKLPTHLTEYAELNGIDTEINRGTLVDINSDGLTDIVIAYIDYDGVFHAETYLKTVDGWVPSSAWELPKPLRSYDKQYIDIPQFTQLQIDKSRLVDVNGDGLVDLVHSYEHFTDATQANVRETASEVYLNSEGGFSAQPSPVYVPPTSQASSRKEVLVDYTSNGDGASVMRTERARLIDINGDGLVDWVTAYFDYVGSNQGNPYQATYLNTGAGWDTAASAAYKMEDYFVEYIGTRPPLPHGEFVDINSDGLVDWVQSYQYIGRDSQPIKATWLNTGEGWSNKIIGNHHNVAPDLIFKKASGASITHKRGSFIDLNGDGLRDWVVSYVESSASEPKEVLINTGQEWVPSSQYKPDFAHTDYQHSSPNKGWPVNTRGTYLDVNRDGLVDYVEAYRPIHKLGVSQSEEKNLWLNTGDGWIKRNDLHPGWILNDYDSRQQDTHKISISTVFDVNSDGSPDWVKVREGEISTRVNRQSRPNQLASITTNMGVEVKPTFNALSSMSGLYTRVPISSVTDQKISKAQDSFFFGTTMYVTSKLEVTRPDDESKYNETTYRYGGGQVNREGRGFLGFYEFITTDPKGHSTRTEFTQEWPLTGRPFKSVVSNATGLLSESETQYNFREIDSQAESKKRVFPFAESSINKAYEINGHGLLSEKSRSLQYDDYGNLEVETTITKSPSGTVLGTKTVTNQYHGYGSGKTGWPLSLVNNTATVHFKPGITQAGDETLSNEVDYEYYPNGQIHKVLREPNSLDTRTHLIVEYVYDIYGNVDTETQKAFGGDLNARVTDYDYDANHRLPEYITNAKGHQSKVTYHPVCDTPETARDPNLLESNFTYTNFCLEKTATAPNSIVKTTTYNWGSNVQTCLASSGCQSTPKLEVTVETSGQASSIKLFNRFNQAMVATTQGMDLADIKQISEVDQFGRTVKQSQPFFSSDAPVYQTFEFDDHDRTERVNFAFETYPDDSGIIESAYTSNTYSLSPSGLAVVTTRDTEGRLKSTYTNALGQVTEVKDAKNQSIKYRYNARGDLKETEDHLGNVIEVRYDSIGRKTELDDPDLGLTMYRHSPFGEIVEQEDAEGYIIYSEYDTLGRMVKRRVPTNETNTNLLPSQWTFDVSEWEYDLGENKKGLLNKVTMRTKAGQSDEVLSYEKSYSYDQFNRVSSETSNIKGNSFTQRYGYNVDGQLNYREYPSSGGSDVMSINLNYQNGYLSSITDKPLSADACIEHWRANKYDALGRLREERLGSFIDTKRIIDNKQGVVRGIQASINLGTEKTVQNLVYDYDATNNVKLRHDALTGVTEEFDYDELDRLTEHTRNSNVVTTVLYNAIGNISYKSDVGTYHYDGSKPHALTSVTLPLGQNSNLTQFKVNWDMDGNTFEKALPSIHGQTFTYDKKGSIKQSGNRRVYWTAFSKPSLMIAEQANSEQIGSAIEYDADFKRMFKQKGSYSSFSIENSVTETSYYVGKDYERIDNSEGIIHRYHISAGSHSIQIERKDGSNRDEPKYLLTDNQGSTNVIINSLGKVVQRLEFDPWGMRTEASPLLSGEVIANDSVNSITNNGYTGHEMDDEVGLINMNARIYDPYLGRFLSADPVLPDAGDMQQFNRYSYVLNNPLKFTDPTGNSPYKPGAIVIPPQDVSFNITYFAPSGIFGGEIRFSSEVSFGHLAGGIFGLGTFFNQEIRPFDIIDALRGFRNLYEEYLNRGEGESSCNEGINETCGGGSVGGSEGPTMDSSSGEGIDINFHFGESEEASEEAPFNFTSEDARKTLLFFFEGLRDSPVGSAVRGINPVSVLEKLSSATSLTNKQIEIALEIATSLTLSVKPGRFAIDAARFTSALISARSIGTVVGRAYAVFNTGLFVRQVTLERDLRGHLDNNFSTFKRGFVMGNIFGSGLNGSGNQALINTRNLMTLPGAGETTRVQQLVDEFGDKRG